MTNPISSIVKVIKRMSSVSVAGGLSVSDSAIRYFRIEDERPVSVSLRLPSGIVEGGRIKNRTLAVAAFTEFRSMIPGDKSPEVVVTLGSGSVYSQFFTLPQLDPAGVKEAAELNLQMISPISIDQAYFGYQFIGEANGGTGYEFLGGFVQSSVVDEWLSVFKESDIIPVVIEFQSLSIVRAASLAGMGADQAKLIVDVSSEGMSIMIARKGGLSFDYFYSWKNIQGEDRSIPFEKLKQIISTEIGKVINFSLSRFGNEIKDIVVNTEGLS
ncbi:MAG: hypothetical protein PHP35_01915, partial [Candidatus Colwellbacteria bacterium]|nr:hypothetical protein [Candidatus Colwellbacteria bacterium]